MRKYVGLAILSVFILVGVPITLWVNFTEKAKEYRNFMVEPWIIKKCPFPFRVRNQTPEKKNVSEVITEINKDFSSLKYGDFFVPEGKEGKVLLTIRYALLHERIGAQPCAPILLIDDAPNEEALAFFQPLLFSNDSTLAPSRIVLCRLKYLRAKRLYNKPRWLKLPPWKMVIKHELLHSVFGAKHLKYDCGVMCADAMSSEVTKHSLGIVRRIYDPVCRK